MPLPDFNIDGVLPPFMGANGPGGHFEDLSPYKVSVLDVAQGLSSTDARKSILRGWLLHRRALRAFAVGDSINRFGASLPSRRKRFTSPTGSLTLASFAMSVIVARTSCRF